MQGKWVGTGPEDCTDPKLLREAITQKPDEFIKKMSINTFLGERITFSGACGTSCVNGTDSVKSLWKPIDFVYNPVSFSQFNPDDPLFSNDVYDPIVSVCYELNVSISQQTQGIQSIDIDVLTFDYYGYDMKMKVSPPGYLHQNLDVRTRKGPDLGKEMQEIELDYQIDNILTDENCNPDPSFNRDECVTKQLLNVVIKLFLKCVH